MQSATYEAHLQSCTNVCPVLGKNTLISAHFAVPYIGIALRQPTFVLALHWTLCVQSPLDSVNLSYEPGLKQGFWSNCLLILSRWRSCVSLTNMLRKPPSNGVWRNLLNLRALPSRMLSRNLPFMPVLTDVFSVIRGLPRAMEGPRHWTMKTRANTWTENMNTAR